MPQKTKLKPVQEEVTCPLCSEPMQFIEVCEGGDYKEA